MEFYKINAINNETIKLNEWFWKQVEATIRTIFGKYGIVFPNIVLVDESEHLVKICIVRSNVETVDEALQWKKNKVFILDELKLQALANSNDDYDEKDYLTFEFEVI